MHPKDISEAKQDYEYLSDYVESSDLVEICSVGWVPNDPMFDNTYHKAFFDSKIPNAWDIQQGNSNLLIGIIDNGLDWNHPDISIDNIWQNLGEDYDNDGLTIYIDVNGTKQFDVGDLNGIDDDGNGRIDDLVGFDFYDYDYNIYTNSYYDRHGLNIFGLIAASENNSLGAAGSSFNSKVIHCKAGYNGRIQGDWVGAIEYLADQNADIISMSFFSTGYMQSAQDAINYAHNQGTIVIACGGYSEIPPSNPCPINAYTYPASYENVIGMGILESDANNMRLNSYVSSKIDLLGSRTATFPDKDTAGQYIYTWSMHTSGSTAMTAGILSLLKAHYPTWTNDQIINQLFITAINRDDYNNTNSCNFDFTGLIGHGLVDAEYALLFNGNVDRNLIWNKDIKVYHNIVVQSGKTLTIKDGTNLSFEPNKTFNVYGNLIIEGDLTINRTINILSGGSITIEPGSVLNFNSNASLIVNGMLNAIGTSNYPITFSTQSGTTHSSWGTLTLNGSGTAGSTIKYSDINYGTKIEVINTSNITIQYCNINTTYDGVRFNNSTGSILNNNITTNSLGHGIVAENAANVTIKENVITKTNASRCGVGIYFGGGSNGVAAKNDIYGWDWGICAIWGSSPISYSSLAMQKNNRIRNCNTGIMVYRLSYPNFGLPASSEYYSFNSLSNNSFNSKVGTYYSEFESRLYAYNNWWGNNPPNTSLFQVGSASYLYYNPYLTTDPWTMSFEVLSNNNKIENNESLIDDFEIIAGIRLLVQNKIREAKDYFISYIAKNPTKRIGYVLLYYCYNEETAPELISYFKSLPVSLSKDFNLLLSYLYLKHNTSSLAKENNNLIIIENPNTSLETRAKLNNVYIALYNDNNINEAINIFNDVMNKPELSTPLELQLVYDAITSYANTYGQGTKNLPSHSFVEQTELELNKESSVAESEIPTEYSLYSNYPNPFNPTTNIKFDLPYDGLVQIKVFDILGNEVATLVNEEKLAGKYEVNFNASSLASGVYIYKIQSGSFINSKKMILLK